MPKAKLVLTGEELKKVPYAAKLAGTTPDLEGAFKAGKEIHLELTYRDASQLYRMGAYANGATEEEIKAFDAKQAKIAEAKKKA